MFMNFDDLLNNEGNFGVQVVIADDYSTSKPRLMIGIEGINEFVLTEHVRNMHESNPDVPLVCVIKSAKEFVKVLTSKAREFYNLNDEGKRLKWLKKNGDYCVIRTMDDETARHLEHEALQRMILNKVKEDA